MFGSVATLAGFIAWFVSVIPVLQKYAWRVYFERVSIFKLYNPVDDVSTGESLLFNISVLTAIGAACISALLPDLHPPRSAGQRMRPCAQSTRSRRQVAGGQ